jgi:GlpG protein
MSGVIYGLLGYCGVFNLINPHKAFSLPPSVYILMLLSLVVGWLGLFEFLARMANTAHLSGLLWGCFIAVPSALLSRFLDKKSESV